MKKRKIAVVLAGGGSRTLACAGAMIGSGLSPDQVDVWFAVSSSAIVACYHAAGQIEEMGSTFIADALACDFINPLRPLRGQRLGDANAFIQNGCRSLRIECIPSNRVFASTFEVATGKTHYHGVTPRNAHTVLEAAVSLPLVTAPKLLGGALHVDGGVRETFPALEAYLAGYDSILAFASRPPTYEMPPYNPLQCWLTFPSSRPAREALAERSARLKDAMSFLRDPPAGVRTLLIEPEDELPAGRLTSDPKRLKETFDYGLDLGARKRNEVQAFIHQAA